MARIGTHTRLAFSARFAADTPQRASQRETEIGTNEMFVSVDNDKVEADFSLGSDRVYSRL